MSTHDHHPVSDTGVCYRHPNRPSGVQCQRCDRLVCPDCMHQASVGVHCPECLKGNKQKVYTRATLPGQQNQGMVTKVIIGLNVLAFAVQVLVYDANIGTGATLDEGRIVPWYLRAIEIRFFDEWWRIITSGFGHFGMFHLGMNMFALYQLGRLIERQLGPRRFALTYLTSLIGGSLGALLVSPEAATMGASGAIFGLAGVVGAILRSRRITIQQAGLVPPVAILVLVTFSGNASIGGHVGGFVVGYALGTMYLGAGPGAQPIFGRDQTKADAATIAAAVTLFALCIFAAYAAF